MNCIAGKSHNLHTSIVVTTLVVRRASFSDVEHRDVAINPSDSLDEIITQIRTLGTVLENMILVFDTGDVTVPDTKVTSSLCTCNITVSILK